jgi:glycosyltransferase involved in cell wall biosynthesis
MLSSNRLVRLGVVVPARDEMRCLGRCLTALDVAAGVARLPLDIVVVLDACTDDSEAVALDAAATLASRVHIVAIDRARVGTARRVGVEHLLDILGPAQDWVSTTDADSFVPAHWFRRQRAHRAAGADLVAGTVHVTRWGGMGRLRPLWERDYRAPGSRHVHGANLSFSVAGYRRVGGFSDATSDEDVRLVDAFAASGQSVVWATDLAVDTSARLLGRAPDGFAAYLDRMAARAPLTVAGAEAR